MMTREEYFESLRKLNLKVYMFGKRVENPVDDPVIRPEYGRSCEKSKNAAFVRTENRFLFPALCWYGREQCGFLHDI